jgi:preprotein translocase subunit SecF
MSPREQRNNELRNVEIPGRLRDEPQEEEPQEEAELDDETDIEDALEGDGFEAELDEDGDDLEEEPAGSARTSGRGGGTPRRFSPRALLRLYRGQTSFDFVGKKRWWFIISATIIVAGLISFGFRGFNFGIDFKGGTSWEITASGVSQSKITSAVEAAGLTQPTVEILGGKTVQVEADLNSLSAAHRNTIENNVTAALQKFAPGQEPSITTVGPTWGGQVTEHALIALIAFFVTVGVYISLRFEPKMAIAAFVALVHDLLVTAGVYSLLGFQVTPDTVVAILTILGYSLYDTVVVFDRVRDNARGLGSSGRMTYSEMVNLSMNQTLARSINTSLVAIMPVFAVLVIGAEFLGAVTLQNYGLALFVGLLSGAYSSIFIASPILAIMKEREQRYVVIRQRLAARHDRTGILTPAAAALLVGGSTSSARQPLGGRAVRSAPLRPGAARSKPAATRRPSSATVPSSGNGAAAGATRPAAGQQRPAPRPRKGAKRGGKKRR